MNEERPFSWIKKIDSALIERESIPLLAKPFNFDLNLFCESLKTNFGVDKLKIDNEIGEWRKSEDIGEGLGENPLYLCFTFTPIKGNVFWIISQEDVAKIANSLLINKGKHKGFSSELLQEGFLRYIALETLNSMQEFDFFKELSPKIVEMATPFEGLALTFDIKVSIGRKVVWGRVIIPPLFRDSWNEYFKESYNFERNPLLELTLSLDVGSVSLPLDRIEKLENGDFVLLDSGHFDEDLKKGSAILKLDNRALFHVRIKEDKIKLLDYALYEEEGIMQEEQDELFLEGAPPLEEPLDEFKGEKLAEVKEATTSIKQTPMNLVIEVSKVSMTLEKLLQLQPGNVLELPVSPEKGVNLTLNGKVIGRGELLYLGEALGVKIKEILS